MIKWFDNTYITTLFQITFQLFYQDLKQKLPMPQIFLFSANSDFSCSATLSKTIYASFSRTSQYHLKQKLAKI